MMGRNLPKNWTQTTLGAIATWGSGGTPKRSNVLFYKGEIPWIKTGDLNDGILSESSEKISELGLENSSAKIFPKGSVGIAMYGATIGKTGLFGINAATNQACAVAQPYEGVLNTFLHYYLKSEKQNFVEKGKGGAQPNISQTVIKVHLFPLPPLPEQKRIVAKLDQLFAHLDALKARLDRIPGLLKAFRQSVLTQAVTGKLTEEWREGRELVSVPPQEIEAKRELMKKTETIRRGRKSYKHKGSVQIQIGGKTKGIKELFELPNSWQWVSIDQVIWNISDGPHFSPKYVSKDSGIRFISTRNIDYKGIDFSDAKYVTASDHAQFIKRGNPQEGDVILTKGGSTGIACVVENDTNFSYWVHLALLKPIREFIIPKYLRDALSSPLLFNQSQALTHGVGNQDLGLTRIVFIALPLPSLAEQKEIVRRVDSLFHKADIIEARYEKLKFKMENLPQAILAKAFRGELVEQLPTDGDARELLEEIGKLREEAKLKKRRK